MAQDSDWEKRLDPDPQKINEYLQPWLFRWGSVSLAIISMKPIIYVQGNSL